MKYLYILGRPRFWFPLHGRYQGYSWPACVTVKCPRCRARATFSPSVLNDWFQEPGKPIHVGGKKEGKGACTACGHAFRHIDWPHDAYYCAVVPGGEFWAWNEAYLDVLRARVSGDRVLERQLCLRDWRYRYFLRRLPKHVIVKSNRAPIMRRIDAWLKDSRSP
jgi:hypothetical protein